MAVKILDHALVTEAELREEIKLSSGKEDSVRSAINRSTTIIETFLRRRVIARGSVTEDHTLDSRDGAELQLRHYPVQSVASVHEDYDRVYGASALLTVNVDYLERLTVGRLERISVASSGAISRQPWKYGYRVVRVVYTPGYAATAVPWNIHDVALRHAAVLYFRHQRRMHGIATKQDETGNFTTFGAETLTQTMKRDLVPEAELYRGSHTWELN